MQIILRNGGKTTKFECGFKDTDIIYYPDGRIEYRLSPEDVNTSFRCCANLEYQAAYQRYDRCLEYFLRFDRNKPFLIVRNECDNTSVRRELLITPTEKEKIKKITNGAVA
jgi:hypothetical protein